MVFYRPWGIRTFRCREVRPGLSLDDLAVAAVQDHPMVDTLADVSCLAFVAARQPAQQSPLFHVAARRAWLTLSRGSCFGSLAGDLGYEFKRRLIGYVILAHGGSPISWRLRWFPWANVNGWRR